MAAWTGKMWVIDAQIKQPANWNLEKINNIKPVNVRNCDKKEQIINLHLKPKKCYLKSSETFFLKILTEVFLISVGKLF